MPGDLLFLACHLEPYLEMCLVGRSELAGNVYAAVKKGVVPCKLRMALGFSLETTASPDPLKVISTL